MFLPVVALLCNPVKSKPPLAVLGAAPLAVLVVVFVALLLTKTVPSYCILSPHFGYCVHRKYVKHFLKFPASRSRQVGESEKMLSTCSLHCNI